VGRMDSGFLVLCLCSRGLSRNGSLFEWVFVGIGGWGDLCRNLSRNRYHGIRMGGSMVVVEGGRHRGLKND
jgi:hypothetical protein